MGVTGNENEASGLSGEAIRSYAEAVVAYPAYRTIRPTIEAGVDVDRLVYLLGGRIEHSDEHGAKLNVTDRRNFVIRVPRSSHPLYRRQLIAHEVGHYYLHYLLPKREGEWRACFTGKNEPTEIEANCFARSLLVPSDEYLKASKDALSVLKSEGSHANPSQEEVICLAATYLQVSPGIISSLLSSFPEITQVESGN